MAIQNYPTSDIKEIKNLLGGVGYIREWNTFDRQARLNYFLQDINKRIVWGFIDDSFINIVHGIQWSVDTGRVTAFGVVGWLHVSCTINDLLNLIHELHAHCTTMLEVKDYLNTIQIVKGEQYDKDMYCIYKRIKSSNKVA